MKFDVITIFPDIFQAFLKESLIRRAQEKKLIKKFTNDKHKTVDDRPFGGGLGMVMKVEPIFKAVKKIKKSEKKTKVILFSPRGKKFNQQIANKLSKNDQLIFICGRYEGVDERVAKHIADMELSIGDYVLMGGEIPAMVAMETISRLVPGVVGKDSFLHERVKKGGGFAEYPQYTRPEVFEPIKGKKWKTPKGLLSGNHKEIEDWLSKNGKIIEK
jgi:tRNA (guanine37-N1)-methyltransferase